MGDCPRIAIFSASTADEENDDELTSRTQNLSFSKLLGTDDDQQDEGPQEYDPFADDSSSDDDKTYDKLSFDWGTDSSIGSQEAYLSIVQSPRNVRNADGDLETFGDGDNVLWHFEVQRYTRIHKRIRLAAEEALKRAIQPAAHTTAVGSPPSKFVETKKMLRRIAELEEEERLDEERRRHMDQDSVDSSEEDVEDPDITAAKIAAHSTGRMPSRKSIALSIGNFRRQSSTASALRGNSGTSGEFDSGQQQDFVSEVDTNIPIQDLHLLQLFCAAEKMTMVIRPVSSAAPDLYAGNHMVKKEFCDESGLPIPFPNASREELKMMSTWKSEVNGKGIGVSLKSSPFPPIEGFIPIDLKLSKTYHTARQKERELEDQLIRSGANIQLMNRIRAHLKKLSTASALLKNEVREALNASDRKLDALMQNYINDSINSVDKRTVSSKYLSAFNDTQFLGKRVALWHGHEIYCEYDNETKEPVLTEAERPIFYIHLYQKDFLLFDVNTNETTTPYVETGKTYLAKVIVVSHRTFVISPITGRLEEVHPSPFIAPDFDGLSYSLIWDEIAPPHLSKEKQNEKVLEWAMLLTSPKLRPTFGLAHAGDEALVGLLREVTAWKINHGFEHNNTVKTQDFTKGNYVVIYPTHQIDIVKTIDEFISLAQTAWLGGTPLPLNPNWKVIIDENRLPVLMEGEDDPEIPMVSDGGEGELKTKVQLANNEDKERGVPSHQIVSFKEIVDRFEKLYPPVPPPNFSPIVKYPFRRGFLGERENEWFEEYVEVANKKRVAEAFHFARRWYLLPPRFVDVPGEEYSLDVDMQSPVEKRRAEVVSTVRAELERQVEDLPPNSDLRKFTLNLLYYIGKEKPRAPTQIRFLGI